jgi:predicted O-methyltransferase YrrM
LSPQPDDHAAQAVRQTIEAMGQHPRLDTAVIQTVGAKKWDGLAIALVK